MASSRWRIYETITDDENGDFDRLMREETYWGIGHETHWRIFEVSDIKREVAREAIGERYFRAMYSATKERIPEGVDMGAMETTSAYSRIAWLCFFLCQRIQR